MKSPAHGRNINKGIDYFTLLYYLSVSINIDIHASVWYNVRVIYAHFVVYDTMCVGFVSNLFIEFNIVYAKKISTLRNIISEGGCYWNHDFESM